MKILLTAVIFLVWVMAVPAMAGETASPMLEIKGFDYAADVPGHIGFEAWAGSYGCTTLNPSARTILCTVTIENKPVEIVVRALGTWGRKSKPIGIATFNPPPDFFVDLPGPENDIPAELIITPVE